MSRDKTIYHHPGGRGSNVLCYNGDGHRKIAWGGLAVTCPACRKAMKKCRL